MSKRRLVISGADQGQFSLLVDGDTVTIGGASPDAATVLQRLRVVNIHCVLEVEGDHVTVRNDEPGRPGAPQEMQPGAVLHAGTAQLLLQAPDAPAKEAGSPAASLKKRLRVIDGGDQGQIFLLPEAGTVTLGKDRKYSDIVLHDLYLARVHCFLKVEGGKVEIVDEDNHGLLVNGKKVTRQELAAGDVFRIGNSHIRLEAVVAGEEAAKDAGSEAVAKGEAEFEVVEDEEPVELVVEEESDEDEEESLPEDASEPVRLLHVWRDKLTQLSGQTFGHYKIGPVLGRGRCGVVFRADDMKTGQALALKVFSPQFPHGSQELQRFAAQMKTLLPLRHPHLVALYGAGKTGTYTWVAREYVEGESLAAVIRRLAAGGEIDVGQACRVAIHVGRALEFARKQHLRHGKVTPANILVQKDNGTAKLADLMLGTVLEGSQLWQAVEEHRPLAELAYLSPEQADPEAFEDELSDLYGLGAVVYALLTGRPPFVGGTADEILEQVRGAARVPRPSKLNDDVPAALDKVVLKMLARHQEDRYQTPAEVLEDLEPIAEELEEAEEAEEVEEAEED